MMKWVSGMVAVSVAAMLLLLGCATTPKSGLAQLQGTWVGQEVGGQKGPCWMTIEGDTVKFQGTIQQDWFVGTVALDPKTNPMQATVLMIDCGLRQQVNKVARAIYKLEGNTLTLANHEPGDEAVPQSFAPDPATRTRAFVFTRRQPPVPDNKRRAS